MKEMKQILTSIVTELEEIGALTSTMQRALIEIKALDSSQIEASFPQLRKEFQRRLAGIRVSIDELPNSL
jgi:hypothetical protein